MAPRRTATKLEDVARHLGLSAGTVSLVLNEAPGPSAETRRRVLEAAAELRYRPDRTARLLARRRSRLLGVMIDVRSTYHAELVADLHEAAEAAGYDLVLSTTTPTRDAHRAVETLTDSRSEALLLLGPDEPTSWLESLGRDLPVVVVGRRLASDTVDVVRGADDRGMGLAVDHLAGLGHRGIAFVDGGRGTIATDRRTGYRRAMQRHGLADHRRVLAGDHTEASGLRAVGELLGTERRPTAVLCFNDRVAIGVLGGLQREGLRVPEDVSVVGYDDSPSAQLPHIELTSVNQDAPAQARLAVTAAVQRLDEGRADAVSLVVDPHLVVRLTSAPPPDSP